MYTFLLRSTVCQNGLSRTKIHNILQRVLCTSTGYAKYYTLYNTVGTILIRYSSTVIFTEKENSTASLLLYPLGEKHPKTCKNLEILPCEEKKDSSRVRAQEEKFA